MFVGMCLCIDKSMEFYRCVYWKTQLFTTLNDHCWTCFVATIKKKKREKIPFPWICENNFKSSPNGQNEASKGSLRGILEGSFQFLGIAGAAYSRDRIWGDGCLCSWLFWGRWASNPTFPLEQMHQGANSSSQAEPSVGVGAFQVSLGAWDSVVSGRRGWTADQRCPLGWNPSHSATTG